MCSSHQPPEGADSAPVTTTTRNEAAERLLYDLADITEPDGWDKRIGLVDAALAAERRATVERIRTEYRKQQVPDGSEIFYRGIDAASYALFRVLDEEAAR